MLFRELIPNWIKASSWFTWSDAAAERYPGGAWNLKWIFCLQSILEYKKHSVFEWSANDNCCVCRLDTVLYRKCQGDASRLCHTHGWNETSELMPPGAVFSCLYRHAYRTEEQGRRVSAKGQLAALWSVVEGFVQVFGRWTHSAKTARTQKSYFK